MTSTTGPATPGFPGPSIARIYDYALGGKDNYPSDRAVYEQMVAHYPQYPVAARANRVFLARAVRCMAEQHGIRQFLDLGSGIPTRPNVHEIAQGVHPRARVVYTDLDQTAWTHGRALLAGAPGVAYLRHDVTDLTGVLRHEDARPLIVPSQPLGVLAVAVWHFLPDEQIQAMLDHLQAVLAPGSLLAFSLAAVTNDQDISDATRIEAERRMTSWTGTTFHLRTTTQIHTLLYGLDLLPPGLVPLQDWPDPHPEPTPELYWQAGVARLRAS